MDKEKMAQHREYMKKTRDAALREGNYSMEYKTLYRVLGVPVDATHEQIRSAYNGLRGRGSVTDNMKAVANIIPQQRSNGFR